MTDSNETLYYSSGRDAGYVEGLADGYDNGYNDALDELVAKIKEAYFHKVGNQFDNAILEMERFANKLKK